MRSDILIIEKWIKPNSRVLDLGCGDGELLRELTIRRQIQGIGVDIKHANVVSCIAKGINVIQANLEKGLQAFDDNSFEVVIMSNTIQSIHNTEATLIEMLRVAKYAIVTVPNFGFYKQRWHLAMGQMPVSKSLPYEWFNTPNFRFCTTYDFSNLIKKMGYKVVNCVSLNEQDKIVKILPNLLGTDAIFHIRK